MWPERIMYKINKKTAEKKVLLDKKISTFKFFNSQYPLASFKLPITAQ